MLNVFFIVIQHSLISLVSLLSFLQVEEGSPEWDLLAERNSLDMILYNYIQLLFSIQKNIIEGFRGWNTAEA
jgi:hypothetical protein